MTRRKQECPKRLKNSIDGTVEESSGESDEEEETEELNDGDSASDMESSDDGTNHTKKHNREEQENAGKNSVKEESKEKQYQQRGDLQDQACDIQTSAFDKALSKPTSATQFHKGSFSTPKMRYLSQYRQEQAQKLRTQESATIAHYDDNNVGGLPSQNEHLDSSQAETKPVTVKVEKSLVIDCASPKLSNASATTKCENVKVKQECNLPSPSASPKSCILLMENVALKNGLQQNDITGFKCTCGRMFSSLKEYTVHMGQTGHAPNHSTQLYPHKLVRGQDMWLVNGNEQTQQILKCIRCGESFKSLPDLTMHMMQTQHYANIVSPGQIDEPVINEKFLKDTFKCKVCSESFNNLAELTEHITCHKHYKGHILKSISERAHKLRYSSLLGAGSKVQDYPLSPEHSVPQACIRCEHCGTLVHMHNFSVHVRKCLTITANELDSKKSEAFKSKSNCVQVMPSLSPKRCMLTAHKSLQCASAHNKIRTSTKSPVQAGDDEPMPEPLDLSKKNKKFIESTDSAMKTHPDTADYSVLSAIQSLIDRRFKAGKNNQSRSLRQADFLLGSHTNITANPIAAYFAHSAALHQRASMTMSSDKQRSQQCTAEKLIDEAVNTKSPYGKELKRNVPADRIRKVIDVSSKTDMKDTDRLSLKCSASSASHLMHLKKSSEARKHNSDCDSKHRTKSEFRERSREEQALRITSDYFRARLIELMKREQVQLTGFKSTGVKVEASDLKSDACMGEGSHSDVSGYGNAKLNGGGLDKSPRGSTDEGDEDGVSDSDRRSTEECTTADESSISLTRHYNKSLTECDKKKCAAQCRQKPNCSQQVSHLQEKSDHHESEVAGTIQEVIHKVGGDVESQKNGERTIDLADKSDSLTENNKEGTGGKKYSPNNSLTDRTDDECLYEKSANENLLLGKNAVSDDIWHKNGENLTKGLKEDLDDSPLSILKRKFAPENNHYQTDTTVKKFPRLCAEIIVDTSPIKENPLVSLQKLLDKKLC